MSIKQQSCVEAMKQWREALGSWKKGFSDLWQESDEQALKSIDQAIALAEQHKKQSECTRSHPHENMDEMCELRTEIARLTNELAQLKEKNT